MAIIILDAAQAARVAKKKQILLLSYQQFHLSVLIRILRPGQGPSGAMK